MGDYKDIDLTMEKHPVTGDISMLKGNSAVFQNIREIVLTSQGDYQFDYDVGGNVYRSLFNLQDTLTAIQFKTFLEQQINQYCPEVEDVDINVTNILDDRNAVNIDILFYIKDSPDEINLTIPVEVVT